jgi:hypothetical protein
MIVRFGASETLDISSGLATETNTKARPDPYLKPET